MNQHLVSKVLLKRFTNPPGKKKIGVLDVRTLVQDERGIDKVGALQDFVVKGANKTEEKWRKVEQRLPRAFELIEQRKILKDEKFLNTIKDLIALHFARSFAMAELYAQQLKVKRQELSESLLQQVPAAQIVRALTGLEALPSSAESLARDLLANRFDAHLEESGFRAKLLLDNYQRGRALAANAELEFWYTTDELVLGDLPAVSYDRNTDAVGILNGVAWGNADALFMPLGPHHAVALTKTAAYLDADAQMVERMNVMQVRGAYREIYYRHDSGLGDLIADALRGKA